MCYILVLHRCKVWPKRGVTMASGSHEGGGMGYGHGVRGEDEGLIRTPHPPCQAFILSFLLLPLLHCRRQNTPHRLVGVTRGVAWGMDMGFGERMRA